ncbi:Protein of unknown function [Pyronema omphalodes CBS 100304]|uniref:Uncharacterized protein n=1 Tax=Pyronema omphalodes (strain CBS 100304) TaxID=1076935 RepID=U4L6A8_PYROM|nr:Protein of unknown function [Pyronema omphalodes CBS 100304]
MNQQDYDMPDGMLIDTPNTPPAGGRRSASASSPRDRLAALRNSASPQQNPTYGLAPTKLTNQVPPQYLQQNDGQNLHKNHQNNYRHGFAAPVDYEYHHQSQVSTLPYGAPHLAVRDLRNRDYESPPPQFHQHQQNTLFVPVPSYGSNDIDMFCDQQNDMFYSEQNYTSFASPGISSLLSVGNRMDVDVQGDRGPQRSTSRASKRSLQIQEDDGEDDEQDKIRKMKRTGTGDLGRGDGPAW